MRSICTLDPKSNITSASSNTEPNVLATVTTISSNNDMSPVHSPRGPPSSRRPIEILEVIKGLVDGAKMRPNKSVKGTSKSINQTLRKKEIIEFISLHDCYSSEYILNFFSSPK
mmetsp:Transcript_18134/g.19659  ORF Transcript_18134/g.19659 Transcript_18134/m.19659 type:complete len:114 (-) Transcript_18134:941-1282(-)